LIKESSKKYYNFTTFDISFKSLIESKLKNYYSWSIQKTASFRRNSKRKQVSS